MATERTGDADPTTDPAAGYDYQGGTVERPDLVDALESRVAGEVRFDTYSRQLFATDASIYQQTPIGVVAPRSTEDVARVVEYCAAEGIPVLPRGGGTSLAGQAVNEAVVLDFSKHMDAVQAVDPEAGTARAQSGVILAELNAACREYDLKFAPDPAWGDKSVLGGAIGNNSTGAHSLQYGKTDAYVESCEVVLADGTVTTFEEVTLEEARERADGDDLEAAIYREVVSVLDEQGDAIREAYPELKRNVSGYNLDWLVTDAEGGERGAGEPTAEGGTLNLAKLLCGSEGTLAVVTEATVALEPVPETTGLTMLCYDDLVTAMEDVATILEHDPAALEVLDDVLLELARNTAEFEGVAGMLPEGTQATLLVEFYADSDADGRERLADFLADRCPTALDRDPADRDDRVETDAPVRAFDALEAHDAAEQAKIWKLRKSGLPILLGRTTDEKHIAFIEDTAIPPENLPEYVQDAQAVFEAHDTFASFYAHAGPGVLHIRPLVNTKTEAGVETMASIADDITDLVVEYGGSVSGEHGDGRARTQWNRKLYGEEMWATFQDLKAAFDPDWLLNPGQVVGWDAPDAPKRAHTADMTEHLRFGPDYDYDGFDPALNWDNDNGMEGMVELCHGCGGCRGHQDTTGGVMCPTYRAADEEVTATRGRANMLRAAMSGDLPDDPTDAEFVEEVMALCVGCKGCAKDCPSEVDMAKLKAEVTHQYHQDHGASLRDRLFANVDTLAKLGSATAPVSNWFQRLPGAGWLTETAVGIAAERDLPTFHRESFRDWFAARDGPAIRPEDATRKALVFPDTYTNYSHPAAGKATVRVLEAAGVHVQVPEQTDSGRPAHSKGFLDHSREIARENVAAFAGRLRGDWDLVVVEPSDAVMFQSDYLDLLGGDAVATVADNTYAVCEYLDRFDLDRAVAFDAEGALTYHGHCHQKATKKDHHAVGVLRRAGYDVDPLDSGCCGMAGSFGYEAEHYSMSRAIGDILFDQVDDSDGERVVAPGTSCRTQLDDGGADPETPIEALAAALA